MNRTFYLGVGLALTALTGQPGSRQGLHQPPNVRRSERAKGLRPQGALHAHPAEVRALAYSHDGRLLASAGAEGSVKFWAPHANRCVRTLRARTPCVGFSPNSRWLATANYEPNLTPDTYARPAAWAVMVWDVRSSRLVHKLSGHKGPVESVSWSPNGALLASASDDGSVRLWLTRSWRGIATLREPFSDVGPGDHVSAERVLFAPDGKTLAVVSTDLGPGMPGDVTTHVALWDTATWKRRRLLLEEQRCVSAVAAFAPDSRHLVLATQGFPSDGNIYAWDLPDGPRKDLTEGEDASYAAALIPPGRWFVAGGKGWVSFQIDLRSGHIVARLPHPTAVTAMAASPDGGSLATGDYQGTIRFWAMPPPTARAARAAVAASACR